MDVVGKPLLERRTLLEKQILPKLHDSIRCSPELKASLNDLMQSVKARFTEP
jgi:ATP-dependent DNA ligase